MNDQGKPSTEDKTTVEKTERDLLIVSFRRTEKMMNGLILDDNMSNLTSASNEASISSSNRNIEVGTVYPHQYSFASANQPSPPPPPPPKKRRNLPGNPDPDAEVVALSPITLMATNRFICEICNKGFQRDQNLQLHRRGHNLPWKLKLRTSKEVKKKVYVCPEPTCVHHDPSRALGDLTGIKKHFSRKHCEKKWKCEKCSKRYAVQSDWKAHSKICGTREYRCDCGTLFSRRDSFITHRAFCDALAEESARTITGANPLLSLQPGASTSPTPHFNLQNQLHNHSLLSSFPLKSEENQPPQSTTLIRPDLPAWLASQPVVEVGGRPDSAPPIDLSTQVFSSPSIPSFQPIASPHMSATALLQKAALMGVTMTKLKNPSETISRPHQAHTGVKANIGTTGLFSSESLAESTAGSGGLVLSSREERESGFVQSFSSPFGEKAVVTSGCMEQVDATLGTGSASDLLLLNNNNSINMMCSSLPCGSGFDGSSAISFEEALNGMLNPRMDSSFQEALTKPATETRWRRSNIEGGGGAGGNDDLTRDFLGLKALSHGGFPNIAAGFDQINSSSSYQQYQNQSPWQG